MALRYLETFLETLAAERASSQKTLEAYASDLHQFSIYTQEIEPQNTTTTHIKHFLDHLTSSGRKISSRNRALSALKQFFRYLISEGFITKNPTLLFHALKSPRPLPKVLSEEEMIRLLTLDPLSADDLRFIVLLEILYAAGLRVSELVSLKRSHLYEELSCFFLRIYGKGRKERLIPLHQRACVVLQNYLNNLPPDTDFLFPSQGLSGHLTRQGFGLILKKYALKANIDPQRVSPHVIRHAFATHLLHRGLDILSLQKLLGHEHISTTQIYTHVTPKHVYDLVSQHHPLMDT